MALLTREAILAADDILTKIIEVPAWGGEIKIKAWSVAEADAFGKLMLKHQKDETFIEQMREIAVSMSVIDEDGKPVFTTKDLVALGKKSPAALNHIYTEVLNLNRVQNGSEEAEKND